MLARPICLVALLLAVVPTAAVGKDRVLDKGWHHVRNEDPREWTEFPEEAEGERYELTFEATENIAPATLLIRQQDVKRRWTVTLNEKRIGLLPIDEIDLVSTFAVAAGGLLDGENRLVVETRDTTPDDIRIGHVHLVDGTATDVFSGTIRVNVTERTGGDSLPAKIAILDENGSRAALHTDASEQLAVRPGVVYTGTGRAEIAVRPGRYEVSVGRGFEYGRDQRTVDVVAGKAVDVPLQLKREVNTAGWIACDPHVHTLTESGHGDCTLAERMVTLAGEGIELPIATEHNKHSDYGPTARRLKLDRYFTTVIGNEVTTKVGHFNVFPVKPGAAPPDHTPLEWKPIFENVYATPGVRAVILNHARDIHSGVRPFGPDWHVAPVGRNLKGWTQRANAMEVVNSSAQQTDVTQLYRDWFGMLNAGNRMTPVGSSDSHDVARHFVGQGRTYIRCDDTDAGHIDVDRALDAFLTGRVLVSCGLLVTISVDGKFGPGDLVPAAADHSVTTEVRSPSWISADQHEVYCNGRPIAEREGATKDPMSVDPKLPNHDVWLVAVATGPGVRHPAWPIAKPYQPDSPEWTPRVIGLTGAVLVDGDGDGRWTSPKGYAERVLAEEKGEPQAVVTGLAKYDAAVAAQAAALLHDGGLDPLSSEYRDLVRTAPEAVQTGFEEYAAAWRESVLARGTPRE